MEERKTPETGRRHENASLIAGVVAVILAAFVLVFAVTAGNTVSPTATAGDVAPVAAQEAATVVSGQTTNQVVAAGSAIAAQAEETVGEVIADEENPLGAYPFETNPLEGFTWLLLAAIIGASVFFVLSMRRANKDISRMEALIR